MHDLSYHVGMKKQLPFPIWLPVLLAIIVVVFCVLFFLLFNYVIMADSTPNSAANTADASTPSPTCVDLYQYYGWTDTVNITVYNHSTEQIVSMGLEEYILGVVAAEMPASYSLEALKAQAVASRTYALYNMEHGGSSAHPDAAVCTASNCCQAYADEARLMERWGADYATNYNRIAQAVMSTAGQTILYEGELIDAMYHACSGGATEDSENVYSNAIPYLRGVSSPFEEPMREQNVSYSYQDLVALLQKEYPDCGITVENARYELYIDELYPSGRVAYINIGFNITTGKKFRSAANLDSAMFTLAWTDEGVTFLVKGFGHGVGLSQNGANGMGIHGSTYLEILNHYYTGVTIG